jgi:phosphatidate phosphatase APP1
MIKKGKPIRDREEVVFFPTAARWDSETNHWCLQISGAVYDPQKIKMQKKLMVRVLRRILKASNAQVESELFQNRIRPFTANVLKGRAIPIQIGSRFFDLQKRTKRNGHFTANVKLTPQEVDSLVKEGAVTNRLLNFNLILGDSDDRKISGRVHLLLPGGNSVISDIDDTIKLTNVGNRAELLRNTFLRDFEPIDGMADQYRKWADAGADFHYVSASPWQLVHPLSEFLNALAFPQGTLNLMVYKIRDSVVRRLVSEKWIGKAKVIRKLVRSFPQRNYILVGDSVERDPELYAHLAESFPNQIKAILIRQVPDFEMAPSRVKRIQSQLSGKSFKTFAHHQELPDSLPFQNS